LKYKELLKNEWVKTVIMLAIVLIAFFAFWFGIRFALATEYPLLAVASPSMVPTLNVGDLIAVHGVSNVSEIYTHYGNGDIIIFHTSLPSYQDNLRPGYPDELIVHRAINRTLVSGVWYFTTKGDNNQTPDFWRVPDYYIVGKVVGVVPWIGNIPLFIRTPEGLITVVILIVLVVLVEFIYSSWKEQRKLPEGTQT
jgi:signal peptidase